jgi:hypothetical protein
METTDRATSSRPEGKGDLLNFVGRHAFRDKCGPCPVGVHKNDIRNFPLGTYSIEIALRDLPGLRIQAGVFLPLLTDDSLLLWTGVNLIQHSPSPTLLLVSQAFE